MIVKSDIAVPYKWDITSRLFESGFTKNLVKQAKRSGLDFYIDTFALQIRAKNLFEKNLDDMVDEAAQNHYLMTSYVLAAYIHLSGKTDEIYKVYSAVDKAFSQTGRFWVQMTTRVALFFNKDRLTYLKKMTDQRRDQVYGQTFDMDCESTPEGGFVSVVRQCGYHQFFVKNGAPELTPVFCAWDERWAEQIDPLKHNVTFSRPCTIADGSKTCRFEFLPILSE